MKNELVLLIGCCLVILVSTNIAGCQEQEGRFPKSGKGMSRDAPIDSGPMDFDLSLPHEGGMREYRVHLPPGYRGDGARMPVFIYVHGGGGNYKSAYKDKVADAADRLGFILVAPNATNPESMILGSRWNGGRWKGGQCCGEADDVGFLSKMIDQVLERFNADPKRVYAGGISNGGLMVNRLACELSRKIAAVVTVAPAGVMEGCQPERPISVMNIHGTGDLCNPFDGSEPVGVCGKVDYRRMGALETVAEWRRINGCSGEGESWSEGKTLHYTRYPCREGAEVLFCKVDAMGHTWPSGSQYFFQSVVGPVSYEISMDQIWNFFMRHPLP